ncbi:MULTISPECIES: GNAT family N-acetyltransferase [Variovorax]|jgi:ribosomal protein S18 acetylase RimI-like enzyme|uniref:GNAT family N-acetyltransferase n=1 Tax=Variovorax TaxID=34072 RepID=UPI0008692193|nr:MULTISPECIES: GNAT family N-acetyltransferase [Variovorax]MBN8756505.1 GNAT family N-acetyltransferase [Variovorax sp.]ODU13496.1 MAG: GNAT family N-acetyltransferase [Variovorax sp. SCN 67-85]ODV24968.1 MAG: GNAT family N-acetyltransferase [Variovorax sp. SCN 67-20]OJZ11104.1 MAG: GNAT family N-acetyltransferase [Variovorax sp. 67-131]UKI06476.1 GNAT family N-acetyltransferase [Variovorax paradoxus]
MQSSSPLLPLVRAMRAGDLDAVLAIQLACYGAGFVEDGELIARRLAAAPHTGWVAEHGGGVRAYLAGYPSMAGKLTPLHGEFEVAAQADSLYLHDLAVHPDASGLGLGPRLVRHAWAHAAQAGWRHSTLVSVQSSVGFWERQGYATTQPDGAEQQARLATYPGRSIYMIRRLDAA